MKMFNPEKYFKTQIDPKNMPEKTHYSPPICSEHYFIIIMVTIVQVL